MINKKGLFQKVYPVLKRISRNTQVRTEIVQKAKDNNIDPHISIGFLNGTIDFTGLDDDTCTQLTSLLCQACDNARVPHNIVLEEYVIEDTVSVTTTYNQIVLDNAYQMGLDTYAMQISGEDIYRLYYEEFFDLSYLASIPQLHMQLSDPDNIMSSKQEMEANRLATSIAGSNVPLSIQVNVSPMQDDMIQLLDDKLYITDNELEIIDIASFYNIYAITKMRTEHARKSIRVTMILYTMDRLQLNAYRQIYFTGWSLHARYFGQSNFQTPTTVAIERLMKMPSMNKILGPTRDYKIHAYELTYYWERHFKKRNLDHIIDLFCGVLTYVEAHSTEFLQKQWSYRTIVLLCRTIDKADQKGIDNVDFIGQTFIDLLDRVSAIPIGKTYNHIANTSFKRIDAELEVLLCTTKK